MFLLEVDKHVSLKQKDCKSFIRKYSVGWARGAIEKDLGKEPKVEKFVAGL